VMVATGFYEMTYTVYFTEIGLRYLVLPIFALGFSHILKKK